MTPWRAIRDFWTLLVCGRFRHADYAFVHLNSRYLAPLALFHYMAVGEARGARPTPLFDPEHFARYSRACARDGALFARFLRAPRGAPACEEFDEAFYCARHPDAALDPHSPWAHAERELLRGLADPAPRFSTAFVATVYPSKPKRRARALMRLFHRRRDHAASLPLNPAELKAAQARFRAKVEIRTLREGPRRHECLVFVQTDGRHPALLEHEDRNYDLLLNFYAPPQRQDWRAEYAYAQRGTKVTAIDALLSEKPEILLQYDYVHFLDDDIEISPPEIDRFFAIMRQEKLDLAQPALTPDSYGSSARLYRSHRPGALRRLSHVEIMAPALSRRALELNRESFAASISGYGVDVLVGAVTRAAFGPNVAVVDAVTMRHFRPIDSAGGALYRFLRHEGIDPGVEWLALEAERGLIHDLHEI